MRLTYTLMLLLFVQLTDAQGTKNQFTLEGKLTGKPVDSVIVSYRAENGKYSELLLPVVKQQFLLKGNIKEPVMASMYFKNAGEIIPREMVEGRRLAFYLEPGNGTETKKITVMGDPQKVNEMKISGSKTQCEFEELNAETAAVRKEMEPVLIALRKEKDHEKNAEIREQLTPFNERITKITYQFFLDHPNSYVTADRMIYYVSSLPLESLKKVYANFNPEIRKTDNVMKFAADLKKIESGIPGSMAADFTTTDINGNKLSLSSFKGKYVLLDFWASWCVPCRKGNPHLIELYNKYHAKGFEIIGVSDDDRKPELWKAAVATDHIGIWNHVLRGLDMELRMKNLPNPTDISDGFGIHVLPTKILIDRTGKIIGRYGDSIGGSEEEMDKILASLFKD